MAGRQANVTRHAAIRKKRKRPLSSLNRRVGTLQVAHPLCTPSLSLSRRHSHSTKRTPFVAPIGHRDVHRHQSGVGKAAQSARPHLFFPREILK